MNKISLVGMFVAWSASAAATAFAQELVLAERLRTLQVDKGSYTLVDVRDAVNFQKRHIEGAINIPKDSIGASELPKGGRVILYCGDARCPLSHEAAKTLMAAGVEGVGVLYGGLAQWEKDGHPVSPPHAGVMKPLPDIDATALRERLRDPAGVGLVDLRRGQDFASGHLPGAASISLETLPQASKLIRKDVEIVVYDRLAQRSTAAVKALAKAGFRVRALSGGIGAWAMKGFPLEAGSQKGS